jgi:hypothetical protein
VGDAELLHATDQVGPGNFLLGLPGRQKFGNSEHRVIGTFSEQKVGPSGRCDLRAFSVGVGGSLFVDPLQQSFRSE